MHGLERTQSLVDEVLTVVIRQVLGPDDAVHVRFHELLQFYEQCGTWVAKLRAYLNQVNLGKRIIVPRLLDVQNADNVLVVEVSQQLHLTQRSEAEHAMIERGNLFDGHLLSRRFMKRRATITRPKSARKHTSRRSNLPDNTIRSLSDDVQDFILIAHVEADLSRAMSLGRHLFRISQTKSLEPAMGGKMQ
jgi:hypothetical protein